MVLMVPLEDLALQTLSLTCSKAPKAKEALAPETLMPLSPPTLDKAVKLPPEIIAAASEELLSTSSSAETWD